MNFLDLVNKRFSVRRYSDQSIEREKIEYILECARMAPSACNRQPWHIYVVEDAVLLLKLSEAYDREWLQSAPLVFVICGDHSESWHRPSDGKDHCDVDISIITEHIALAAADQGLGSCWVCNFNSQVCKKILQIEDENVEPIVMMPIGYPDSSLQVSPKVRKDANEIISFK